MALYWKDVNGRNWPVCSCLKAWLTAYQNELLRVGEIRSGLDVYQTIGGAPKSAGYHLYGGNVDTGQTSTRAIKTARNMGGAAFGRDHRDGMTPHCHIALKTCPHMGSGPRWQVTELQGGRNGLVNRARDRGPRDGIKWPLRTWKAGIVWAKKLQVPEIEKTVDKTVWTVDADDLYGKASPGWEAKTVKTVHRGAKVTGAYMAMDAGLAWVQNVEGTWYAAKHLTARGAAIDTTIYEVVPEDLYGKASPGWESLTVETVHHGAKVTGRRAIKHDGLVWVQNVSGSWFAKKHLKSAIDPPVKKVSRQLAVTYNVGDKFGPYPPRVKGIAANLQATDCHVAGLQECSGITGTRTASAFSKAIRAELDKLGEWRAVIPTTAFNENYFFYRPEHVRLVKRLPDLIIRVTGFEGKHASMSIFEDLVSKETTLYVNTHLEHQHGAKFDGGRQLQGQVIATRVREVQKTQKAAHVIILGDMNQGPSITAFLDLGLSSVRPRAKATTHADIASFQGSSTTPKAGVPIDHIYADKTATVDGYTVIVDTINGRFHSPKASDHLPILAQITYK